jgi:hypothetical protein
MYLSPSGLSCHFQSVLDPSVRGTGKDILTAIADLDFLRPYSRKWDGDEEVTPAKACRYVSLMQKDMP